MLMSRWLTKFLPSLLWSSVFSLPGYRIALSKRFMYVCAYTAHDMLHEATRCLLLRLAQVRSVVHVVSRHYLSTLSLYECIIGCNVQSGIWIDAAVRIHYIQVW